MKTCTGCKIKKLFTEFKKDKTVKSGCSSRCKKCINVEASETTYRYKNSEHGFLQNKIAEIFAPSKIKQRNMIPECTKNEIRKSFYEYVEEHGRNCFYCKEPWTYIVNKYIPNSKNRQNGGRGLTRGKKIKNLSFDRLDSSKTYFVNNIIFCCSECNLSKKDISIELIKRLYEVITERNL